MFPTGPEPTIADLRSLHSRVTRVMIRLVASDENGRELCNLRSSTEMEECPIETGSKLFLGLLDEWIRFHDDLQGKVADHYGYGHLPADTLITMETVLSTGALILSGLRLLHEQGAEGERLSGAILDLRFALVAMELLNESYGENPDNETLRQWVTPAA